MRPKKNTFVRSTALMIPDARYETGVSEMENLFTCSCILQTPEEPYYAPHAWNWYCDIVFPITDKIYPKRQDNPFELSLSNSALFRSEDDMDEKSSQPGCYALLKYHKVALLDSHIKSQYIYFALPCQWYTDSWEYDLRFKLGDCRNVAFCAVLVTDALVYNALNPKREYYINDYRTGNTTLTKHMLDTFQFAFVDADAGEYAIPGQYGKMLSDDQIIEECNYLWYSAFTKPQGDSGAFLNIEFPVFGEDFTLFTFLTVRGNDEQSDHPKECFAYYKADSQRQKWWYEIVDYQMTV